MPGLIPLVMADEPPWESSRYMPRFSVEIAWTSGYTTPAADRVWTDVSDYVELAQRMGITFGRRDELATSDPNSVTLTLDNSDGRFTAGRAASPYYPNVRLGRPIRVSCMTVTGHTSVRFVGFVDEWPVEWDGTDAYASASIRATSRLARLGLSTRLRSIPEMEILATVPYAYWTLGDPSGSTSAAESSGNNLAPLVSTEPVGAGDGAPVVFGSATGVGVDGLTAAQFTGSSGGVDGDYLAAGLSLAAGPQTVRACLKLDALPIATADVVTASKTASIGVDTSGNVIGPVTTGPSVNDGLTHDVVLTRDGTNEKLYVDGALVATSAAGTPSAAGQVVVGALFPGAVSHVAVYTRALTLTEIAQQSQSVLLGNAGDLTSVRLARLLDWAGVAVTEAAVETGVETMTYQRTSGQSVVDALREVESTEGGVLFDGRDGNVTFQSRSHRYLATVAATLDMAAQQVGADYAPKMDRSTLVNDVEVSNPTTGEKARATNTASSDEYGVATGSASSVADTYDPLQQKAAWLVASYAEPRSRVPSLTVDVLAHVEDTPSAETILDLTIGDLIEVDNAPTQADTTTATYFIEGYTETIGPESYSITFNLSPSAPYTSVFVLDDPVRGQLDAGNVLAL